MRLPPNHLVTCLLSRAWLSGHCIPVDPFYLSFKAKEFGLRTRFIELAGEVNASMPEKLFPSA